MNPVQPSTKIARVPEDFSATHGDYSKISEVNQGQYGITHAKSNKTVLATYGLASCVSFIGWSPTTKVGFLSHYDSMTNLDSSISELVELLSGCPQTKYDTMIVGGSGSNELGERIISATNQFNSFKAPINNTADCYNAKEKVESAALDVRTGIVCRYNPTRDPNYAEMDLVTFLDNLNLERHAQLSYAAIPTK